MFASYLIRLRLLDKELLPEFVAFFFPTAGYWQPIKDGSSGSAQGGLNATKLGALTLPVPPSPNSAESSPSSNAAELLLPKVGILRVVGSALKAARVDGADRAKPMDEFQVGETVCSHQLENRAGLGDW